MALSECPYCWETPCVCGKQGYTVLDRTDISKEDLDTLVNLSNLLDLTNKPNWKVISKLDKLDIKDSDLKLMKEYHMLFHLNNYLYDTMRNVSYKIAKKNINTTEVMDKLNNMLKD